MLNPANHTLRASITLTVSALCVALNGSTDGLNGGVYQGTDIKRRTVREDALVVVEDRGVIFVRDFEDGWIAERVCGGRATTIGRRDFARIVAAGHAVVAT